MDLPATPHRCPKCHALVVDRRSVVCTTCRSPLPADWIMTPEQAAKMMAIDKEIRAEHSESMKTLSNPWTEPARGASLKDLSS